ncbi:ABC transporter substrate-binding protein [Paradevosia shaoguanensis]|uniref:ABC transporter substrate-binding protein n=1 Tax=Paradevosia shaoguanensis TaxID=1335043 RepID=A0AA41QI95_9HYPH|nr:ABC transporter substrate-binding protein [Paradevosia shaoguanensis]MCF1740931.1 ABC transporter substrate-binding protein [Paradevosia shaoguanensis]MCI0125415.1 ABC transporter substrate-binding protein [Paradevosia shaoguanensis]
MREHKPQSGVRGLAGLGRLALVSAAVLTLALAPQAAFAQVGTTNLVMSTPQEPPNWDYTVGTATAINGVLFLNVIEPLLETQQDGSLKPLLASYEVTPDGLTYTFKLVKAKFHDGTDFDADDVLYSFEQYKKSPRPEISKTFDAVSNIEKVDASTVKVTLSRPSQAFLAGMSGLAGMMLPEGGLDNLAKAPVGTGPFSFGEWKPGIEVDVKRFEDYHGDKPYFENVRIRFIGDEIAAVNALMAGDIDLINVLVGDGKERADAVKADPKLAVLTTPSNQVNYIALDAKNPKFADIRVRQAIAHAINREDIAIGAYSGFAEPACLFVNPANLPWNSDYCPYPYDPEKAQALLTEAGVSNLDVELKYYNISDGPAMSELLTDELGAVGINVKGASRELAAYLDEVLGSTPNFEMTTLTGPQTVDSFLCPGWFASACVPEFDEAWNKADAAVTADEATALRKQAVNAFADAAWVIPTVAWMDVTYANAKLAGWKPYRSQAEADLRGLHWAE